MAETYVSGTLRSVRRRDFLIGAAAGVAFPAIITRRAFAAGTPTVVNSIRSLSNPYHATWNKGGAAFAKSVGAEYVTLVTEGNSEKGVSDIKAILAKTGGNCVINVDPNDSPDARPIVEACKAAGAMWSRSGTSRTICIPGISIPTTSRTSPSAACPMARRWPKPLFKAMGGKGGIVALGGIESNVPAIERKKGLDQALAANPNVKLLDFQVANWQAEPAHDKMAAWLTQFGDDIKGVWAANDDMALAAVEALRAEGKAGKVPVTGIDGIKLVGRGDHEGRDGRHRRLGSLLAGRHGPVDRLPRQDRQVRPRQGAERPSRVLRQRQIITADNAKDYLRQERHQRGNARLERHLGPLQRPDPVRLAYARAGLCAT